MKRRVLLVIIMLYVFFAIFITVVLFKKNENGAFETKNYLYVSNSNINEYSKSSLIRFNKNSNIENMVDREIYYFDNSKEIKKGKVISYSKNDNIFMINDKVYDTSLYLGIPDKEYVILGSILSFFTKKIAYLLFIIVPMVILFIYEILLLYKYLKDKGNKYEKNT